MKLNQYEWNPDSDEIGEGGFAKVYKVTDNLGSLFALKIYNIAIVKSSSGGSGSNSGKYSLELEYAKGKDLSHTNVIKYVTLDYIVHTDFMQRQTSIPALIMEYADAGSLENRIEAAYPSMAITGPTTLVFSMEEITTIALEILDGLGYLHRQGIIHRDLKPANILFKTDRTGRKVVKITDFGISRDTLEKAVPGSTTTAIGTTNYMAPEQFLPKTFGLDGSIGNRTDIWAFGVIFYRMLTGRLPFNSQEEITGKEPDYSKMPAKYSNILKGCLQKQAAMRFPDAKSVTNAINNAAAGVKPEPPKPQRIPNPKPVGKRILVAVIVVAVLALTSFAMYRYKMKDEPQYVTDMELQLQDSAAGIIKPYTYTGWIKNGQPDGQGTKIYKDGMKYVGESKLGKADGQGTLSYKVDGGTETITGDFKDGLAEGKDLLTRTFNNSNATETIEGVFKNGAANGLCTFINAGGDKYVGEMKNGNQEGQGTFYSLKDDEFKGDRYEGSFANGVFDGYGVYYWHAGNRYDGQWKNGKMEGEGTYFYTDGWKFVGSFKEGKRNGFGKLYDENTKLSTSGDYENGVLVKSYSDTDNPLLK